MQRYNIFNQLHKGVEALLSDTVRMLRQTDFTIAAEAQFTINRVNRFLRLFADQAYLEDQYLLPALEMIAPATVFVLEQDHQDNRLVIQRVKAVLAVYERSATTAEKQYAGKSLVNVFTQLMILALRHLSREEDMVNSILWTHFSDEYIARMEQEMMTYIPPEDLSIYNYWTTHHLDTAELDSWLVRLEEMNDRETFQEVAAFADHDLMLLRTSSIAEEAMVA